MNCEERKVNEDSAVKRLCRAGFKGGRGKDRLSLSWGEIWEKQATAVEPYHSYTHSV